jgi:DNA-binding MarR family transcriptional regulator
VSTPSTESTTDASELRLVLGQLLRRLRAENTIPISHLAVLSRLDREGPQTTSSLATAERMRPQSMAQIVTELNADGLVARRPDADDRRQVIVELTAGGRKLLGTSRRQREDWLSRAIADELSPGEQKTLAKAIAVLRRLAEL